ncbi:MAG: diaminopimelate epimerase [Ruminococcaceae bacterium]|nr:diaminopimelate epimerase [Oscillospiraceae bacterium]
MKRKFYKMHGAGNDYIYFNCFEAPVNDPEELSVRLSRRRFSIGSDGIVLVLPSDKADGRMRIFNADGSEAKMCGNGIRCVGKALYEIVGIKKNVLTVETESGIKRLILDIKGDKVAGALVEMGKAVFEAEKIPAVFDGEMIEAPFCILDKEWKMTAVSVGNPHSVIFTEDIDSLDLEKIGPHFENHPVFPDRVNTEFIEVVKRNELKMRVWERGSGETLACGTGASASAAAAVRTGRCDFNVPIKIELKGGTLYITVKEDYSIIMKGPCELAYTGEVEI